MATPSSFSNNILSLLVSSFSGLQINHNPLRTYEPPYRNIHYEPPDLGWVMPHTTLPKRPEDAPWVVAAFKTALGKIEKAQMREEDGEEMAAHQMA